MSKSSVGAYRQVPMCGLMLVIGAIGGGVLTSFGGRAAINPAAGLASLNWFNPQVLSSSIPALAIAASALLALMLAIFMRDALPQLRGILAFGRSPSPGARAQRPDTETPEISPRVVSAVRDGLDKQLTEFVKTVARFAETTEEQSATFESAHAGLSPEASAEQIRTIVEVLLASSAQGQREAEALKSRLKEAQAQSLALRKKLVKVEKLATLDALTSLPNRRHFDEFIESAVEDSHSDYTPLCVVMADIDHFKKINDTYGHQVGDAVLRQFSAVLQKAVRPDDLVARYGGEEFVVVLKKTSMGNARQVAERLRERILGVSWKDPKTDKDIGRVTASFGVAEIADNEDAQALVGRADSRLYAAKRLGRNRVEVDTVER